jgi:hypothetical protein
MTTFHLGKRRAIGHHSHGIRQPEAPAVTPPPAGADALLLETADYYLLESGDHILLEV